MKQFFTTLIVFLLAFNIYAQSPKREFRAVWLATVENLDWPSSRTSVSSQKDQLIQIFDELQKNNINVVVFQIRTECDALYESNYEPWSYYLSGNQGSSTNPEYDPLKFAIDEAHKRGMELHTWINPYRAVKTIGEYQISPNHVSVQHPDWIITKGTYKFLNPGLPQVQDYIKKVVVDIVSRYDIDGFHMDDYFYPYDGMASEDTAAYRLYKNGFSNIADWRRNNVNSLVKAINDTLHYYKPNVKFGISPFGIWKSGVPSGISGMSAYDQIYCDAITWLQKKSIDYLTPQLYWPIGGSQDYSKLSAWWADSAGRNGRHFYPGQAIYRISSWSNGVNEAINQIKIDRNNPKTQGQVFFRSDFLTSNFQKLSDSLKANYYKRPALLPVMSWKDTIPPNKPLNLTYKQLSGSSQYGFTWDLPALAQDGDSATMYAIYSFSNSTITPEMLNVSDNILAITNQRTFVPAKIYGNYFVVTALDKNYNESVPSNVAHIPAPVGPALLYPANGATDVRDTATFKWQNANSASQYTIEFSTDSTFTTNVIANTVVSDTVFILTKTAGQVTYYWHVKSMNASGQSDYSNAWKFTTAYPLVPVLSDPPHATTNTELTVTCKWKTEPTATSYRYQLGTGSTIPTAIVDTVVTDTICTVSNLNLNKVYYWRVAGINKYGQSGFPVSFGFRTKSTVDVKREDIAVKDFSLDQNYPNPFNPSTSIRFSLPASGKTTLKVYNLLGKEVATLIDKELSSGTYSVNFNAVNFASGIYIYTLSANGKSLFKKMTFVK